MQSFKTVVYMHLSLFPHPPIYLLLRPLGGILFFNKLSVTFCHSVSFHFGQVEPHVNCNVLIADFYISYIPGSFLN